MYILGHEIAVGSIPAWSLVAAGAKTRVQGEGTVVQRAASAARYSLIPDRGRAIHESYDMGILRFGVEYGETNEAG